MLVYITQLFPSRCCARGWVRHASGRVPGDRLAWLWKKKAQAGSRGKMATDVCAADGDGIAKNFFREARFSASACPDDDDYDYDDDDHDDDYDDDCVHVLFCDICYDAPWSIA